MAPIFELQGLQLDKGFEDVSDKINRVDGKQSFELCLSKIVDWILLHKKENINERNKVHKLIELRNVRIIDIDFDDVPMIR